MSRCARAPPARMRRVRAAASLALWPARCRAAASRTARGAHRSSSSTCPPQTNARARRRHARAALNPFPPQHRARAGRNAGEGRGRAAWMGPACGSGARRRRGSAAPADVAPSCCAPRRPKGSHASFAADRMTHRPQRRCAAALAAGERSAAPPRQSNRSSAGESAGDAAGSAAPCSPGRSDSGGGSGGCGKGRRGCAARRFLCGTDAAAAAAAAERSSGRRAHATHASDSRCSANARRRAGGRPWRRRVRSQGERCAWPLAALALRLRPAPP